MKYEVHVANVGLVGRFPNPVQARIEAQKWVKSAREGTSRADPYAYVLCDGEFHSEHGEQPE